MTEGSPLGKTTTYAASYSPALLFAIARDEQRHALPSPLPFHGSDDWTLWELTWLDKNGKPQVAAVNLRVPYDSPYIVESKSLKLYCTSFSMSRFETQDAVLACLKRDLSACIGAGIDVKMISPHGDTARIDTRWGGDCIDDVAVNCNVYEVQPELLCADPDDTVDECLHSELLRSLCPVTGQPDIGSVLVRYRGPRIDRTNLLRYIVSYREHNDFHEHCVERMFVDIKTRCRPEALTVYARYQRRGGIDINPFRSDFEAAPPPTRLWRQ